MWGDTDLSAGLDALRRAVALALSPSLCTSHGVLLAEAATTPGPSGPSGPSGPGEYGDSDQAASSADREDDRTRLIALVELARGGDKDAFGLLYDHYQPSVYRFLYYRTRSATLAEGERN